MNYFLQETKKSVLSALWLMILTFPLMVLKVNIFESVVTLRWNNMIWIGIGTFFLSWLWRFLLDRKENGSGNKTQETEIPGKFSLRKSLNEKRIKIPTLAVLAVLVLAFPFMVKFYQVSIMTSALMFVILGLGLNIVIGYGGLLHLGYAAFYAMGAYSYGLLYLYWGVQFWVALPLGAVSGAVFGIVIGVPVLRLRGDYLAIVTLAFGEIAR
ncbi:MAG: branched-chain amino acid ABC transporter permease, partial [Spirochaetes bacterium]